MTYDNLETLISENMLVFKYVFQEMGYPNAIPSAATVNNLYNRDPERFATLLYAAAQSSGSNVIDYLFPSGAEEVGPPMPDGSFTTKPVKEKGDGSNAAPIISAVGGALGSVLGGIFGKPAQTTNNYGNSNGGETTTYVLIGVVGVAVVGAILYFILRKK